MQKDPANQKYMQRDSNGKLMLPAGTNMEDFSGNMLRNAYGEYPPAHKKAADKVIYKILAAAAVRRATARAYA